MRVAGAARLWQDRIICPLEVAFSKVWPKSPYQAIEREDGSEHDENGGRSPSPQLTPPTSNLILANINSIIIIFGVICTIGLYTAFPFPTTVPLFIGSAICLSGWTFSSWWRIGTTLLCSKRPSSVFSTWSVRCLLVLVASTILVCYWIALGLTPPAEEYPPLRPGVNENFFIATNLFNNEEVFTDWSTELLKLASYLGEPNTFISIFESNSWDNTKSLLSDFRTTLDARGISHRIVTEDDESRWWPYGTAPERIQFLADARNRAFEPLQSDNATIRLDNHDIFDKIIFLNDIHFTYQSIARLIATRLDGDSTLAPDYDLACAMDFAQSGLYDTWVARDICGTPMRPFWPYAKDKATIQLLKKEVPFKVAACWNGAVVFPSEPYLWRESDTPPLAEGVDFSPLLGKRGWKMIDLPDYPGGRMSPPLSEPVKFRASHIPACDHSEAFLFSYDLHRLYDSPQRPPRIYMNPTVKVAYSPNWFIWQNVILRVGFVRWWLEHWSRGFPLLLVDWIWEYASRRRDYCTWAGLNIPETCPPLPGPADRNWNA